MKLRCLLVAALLLSISTTSVYSNEQSNSQERIEIVSVEQPSSLFMDQKRSIVKRSQRNANILYRYCRQWGGTQPFCLKYAVQMLYATGH